MSFLHAIARGSGQSLAANVIAKTLSVLILPLLTAWLSPALYGEAAMASTLIGLVSVIGLAGMDMSYTRAYFNHKTVNNSEVENLIWRLGVISASVIALIGGLIWLYVSAKKDYHAELALFVGAGSAGSLLSSLGQARARLLANYRRLAMAILLSAIGSYLLMILFSVIPDFNIYALVCGYAASYWITLVIVGWPGFKIFRENAKKISNLDALAIVKVGLPGIITAPVYWVLASSDRWFLGAYRSLDEAGIYALGASFGTLGMMLNSAVLNAWTPELSRLHSREGISASDEIVAVKRIIMLVYAMVWLGVSVLGTELLLSIIDVRFHEAALYVPWIAGGVFFYGCYHLFNAFLFLDARLKVSAISGIIVLICSIIANFWFVPGHGGRAAAIVQFSTFALWAIFVGILSKRQNTKSVFDMRLIMALAIIVIPIFIISQWRGGLDVFLHKIAIIFTSVALSVYVALPTPLRSLKSMLVQINRGSIHES